MLFEKYVIRIPLRYLFGIVLIFVVFLALCVMSVHEIYERHSELESDRSDRITRQGAELKDMIEYHLNKENLLPLEARMLSLATDPDYRLLAVVRPDGPVYYATRREWIGSSIEDVLHDLQIPVSFADPVNSAPVIKIHDGRYIIYSAHVRWPGEVSNRFGSLLIVYDLNRLQIESRASIIENSLVFLAVAISASVFVFFALNRIVVVRLQALLGLIESMERGDHTERVPVEGNDEIATISRYFLRTAGRIDALLHLDQLTGAYNRRSFERRAMESLKDRAEAILFIDLDNFKEINDTFGHEVGDLFLKNFAIRLNLFCTEMSIVGRIGGDEFLVLVNRHDRSEVLVDFVGRLHRDLSEPYRIPPYDLVLNATIGIAPVAAESKDYRALVRDADIALYHGKREGKNRIVLIRDSLRSAEDRRSVIMRRVRSALENGEFFLQYQPIVSVKSGEIQSAEALLRWDCPELGRVPPDEFVPVLEETGMIKDVGLWVLEQSCMRLRAWKDLGNRYPGLNVNISMQQITDGHLIQDLKNIILQSGIEPDHLKLEVTETEAMRDPQSTLPAMEELRAMGVRLALDDFGTGYSSLAYLKLMPLDFLKIDRSFVTDLPDDSGDSALVRSMHDIARSFGFRTIAEGVETERQLNFLAELGCDEIQGFFFSPSVDSETLETMVRERRSLRGRF